MDNPNPAKAAKVDEIADKLAAAGTVVVTEYRGLDVPAQAALRQAVKDAGGEYKIYKNTLTRIAADRAGVDLGAHLEGPTALAFAFPPEGSEQTDPVSLSKALTEFAKSNDKLVIKGGVMDGNVLDPAAVDALSKVPPREEMLAKFAGLLQAPMAKFAGLLQAMPQNFAGLLQALVDKGGAGDAPAADAEASADDADAAPADDADAAPAADAEAADETAAAPADDAEEPAAEATDDESATEQTDNTNEED